MRIQGSSLVEAAERSTPGLRAAKLRDAMRAANLPALLIQDPINILYATGARNMMLFGMRTAARFLLVFAEGPTVLFEYFGCEHLAEDLPTIDRVLPAPGLCHVTSGGNAEAACVAFSRQIGALFSDYGEPIARLGIDRVPYFAVDALRDQGFHLCDADPVFGAARRIKLPEEIVLIREALRRVEAAAVDMTSHILPGCTETEIWADFQRPFLASGGHYVTTRLAQGGPNTFPYFQEAGARRLEAGELFCFDTDTNGFAGYCTDFSRTILCGDGRASDVQKDLFSKAREQLEHNAALIRPGVSFEETAAKAWPVPEEHCDSRYYCIGHGLGMSGEVPNIPHAVAGERYPLAGGPEPGMILCVESYIGSASAGQGVKLEDQFLVTETGTERMSSGVPFDHRLGTPIV